MKLTKAYILTLMAVLLYSCTNEEVFVENNEQKPVSAISFDQSLVDKVSRADINLSTYATTMGVWGYRNAATDNEMIFKNQRVDFYADLGWRYSPLKYWDAQSEYDFYAYTPYDQNAVSIDTTDPRAYILNINNIALTGVNLQETPSAAEKMIFNGTADTDWMVARAGEKNVMGSSHNTVQFSMQHILSKLNVRMRISPTMENLLGEATVTVDKVTIGSLHSKGDFTQKLTATPATVEEKATSATEWSLTDDEITLQHTNVETLTTANLYLIESLVIPQVTDAEDKIYIEYTIHYADHTEKFKFSKSLRDIDPELQQFCTGYNYTLSFLINPDQIIFTANACNWADGATKEYNIIQ